MVSLILHQSLSAPQFLTLTCDLYTISQTEKTSSMCSASSDMAEAASSSTSSSFSKDNQQASRNDLSVDGSVAGHLQELARSISHKVRRNIAVRFLLSMKRSEQ